MTEKAHRLCSKCLASAPMVTLDELLDLGWRGQSTADGGERWWCPECKDLPLTIPKRGKRYRG